MKAATGVSAQCQVQVQDADYLEVTATLPATVNCLAFRRGVPKDEVGIDYLPDDPVIAATLSLEKIDISPYFTETDDGRTVRSINISGHVTALEPDLEIDFYPYLKWIVRDEAGAIVDSEMTVQDWGSYAVGSPIRFRISVEGMTPGCTYTIEFISDDGRTVEEAAGNDTSCRPVGLPYTYTKSWSDGTTTTYTIQEAQVVLEYDPQDDDFEAAITFSGTVEGQENIAYSLPFYWAIADENGALVYTSSSQIASREIQEDGSFTIPPRAGSDSFSLERDHSYTLIFGEERFIK